LKIDGLIIEQTEIDVDYEKPRGPVTLTVIEWDTNMDRRSTCATRTARPSTRTA